MDMKISCGDGWWARNICNASGGANLVPAAAVIPDPGPYVAAGTVKAFDCLRSTEYLLKASAFGIA